MSTHNIRFNEDLMKIIHVFQLSSNTHLISSSGNYSQFHSEFSRNMPRGSERFPNQNN